MPVHPLHCCRPTKHLTAITCSSIADKHKLAITTPASGPSRLSLRMGEAGALVRVVEVSNNSAYCFAERTQCDRQAAPWRTRGPLGRGALALAAIRRTSCRHVDLSSEWHCTPLNTEFVLPNG